MISDLKLKLIITGGQTGVDTAAVKAAEEFGVPYSGWVPKDYKNESGTIAPDFQLGFLASSDPSYESRTERNVLISDATLVLFCETKDEGTDKVHGYATPYGKKYKELDLNKFQTAGNQYNISGIVAEVSKWLIEKNIEILHIAGPRESNSSGIEQKTVEIFRMLFSMLSPPREKHLEMARISQERFFANFRHWDMIRWLIPAWFLVLLIGAAAYQAILFGTEEFPSSCSQPIQSFLWFFPVCWLLPYILVSRKILSRLRDYHVREWENFQTAVKHLRLGAGEKNRLLRELPFSSKNNTAACGFGRLMGWCFVVWFFVSGLILFWNNLPGGFR